LPRNIHLSYHLADVQLHCNQLVTLDPSLFAATSITSLRLDSNMITTLPDDVASASSLQVTFIRVILTIRFKRAPPAGSEHIVQPPSTSSYSAVRPDLSGNSYLSWLSVGIFYLAPKGYSNNSKKFKCFNRLLKLVMSAQVVVKKGAASKRCGCDPPPPEVAGLAPLPKLMDIFRRMCVFSKNAECKCYTMIHGVDVTQAHNVFQRPRLDPYS
jgi:hypothetical protein